MNPANGNSPITNSTIIIQATGVNAIAIMFNNSSGELFVEQCQRLAIGISGLTGLLKNGSGMVTLNAPGK